MATALVICAALSRFFIVHSCSPHATNRLHYAARENLKANFRLEGNVFTNLNGAEFSTPFRPGERCRIDRCRSCARRLRFIRAVATWAHFNQEPGGLSARIVLNPAKASLRPRPPDPKKKITLPDVFPERVHLVDATVIVRNRPHDFMAEHVDLDLDPRNPGQLTIDKLQLVGGQMWLKVAAQTSYANRILILRDVALSNDERIRELRVDASRIAERKLAINLDYSVGAGTLSGSFALNEAQSSLNTDLHLHAGTLLSVLSINMRRFGRLHSRGK